MVIIFAGFADVCSSTSNDASETCRNHSTIERRESSKNIVIDVSVVSKILT